MVIPSVSSNLFPLTFRHLIFDIFSKEVSDMVEYIILIITRLTENGEECYSERNVLNPVMRENVL